MAQEEQNNQGFNIELPEEIAHGVYCNLPNIMHSQSEFILDFIQMLPGQASAKVRSRIIMTPDTIKRLSRMLNQNVQAYEREIAPIVLPEDIQQAGGNDFGQGQA